MADFSVKVVEDILNGHKGGAEGSLISILGEIQERYHYLPRDALILVSEWLGVPLSQVYTIATFYNAFSLQRQGNHLIHVCTGTACHVRGAAQLLDRFQRKLEIQAGETTPDWEFTLETVNCLGACALGPITVVDGQYFGQMTASRVDKLLKEFSTEREKV